MLKDGDFSSSPQGFIQAVSICSPAPSTGNAESNKRQTLGALNEQSPAASVTPKHQFTWPPNLADSNLMSKLRHSGTSDGRSQAHTPGQIAPPPLQSPFNSPGYDNDDDENYPPTTERDVQVSYERIEQLAQPRVVTNPRLKKTVVAFGRNTTVLDDTHTPPSASQPPMRARTPGSANTANTPNTGGTANKQTTVTPTYRTRPTPLSPELRHIKLLEKQVTDQSSELHHLREELSESRTQLGEMKELLQELIPLAKGAITGGNERKETTDVQKSAAVTTATHTDASVSTGQSLCITTQTMQSVDAQHHNPHKHRRSTHAHHTTRRHTVAQKLHNSHLQQQQQQLRDAESAVVVHHGKQAQHRQPDFSESPIPHRRHSTQQQQFHPPQQQQLQQQQQQQLRPQQQQQQYRSVAAQSIVAKPTRDLPVTSTMIDDDGDVLPSSQRNRLNQNDLDVIDEEWQRESDADDDDFEDPYDGRQQSSGGGDVDLIREMQALATQWLDINGVDPKQRERDLMARAGIRRIQNVQRSMAQQQQQQQQQHVPQQQHVHQQQPVRTRPEQQLRRISPPLANNSAGHSPRPAWSVLLQEARANSSLSDELNALLMKYVSDDRLAEVGNVGHDDRGGNRAVAAADMRQSPGAAGQTYARDHTRVHNNHSGYHDEQNYNDEREVVPNGGGARSLRHTQTVTWQRQVTSIVDAPGTSTDAVNPPGQSPLRSTNGYSFATKQFLGKYGLLQQQSEPATNRTNRMTNRGSQHISTGNGVAGGHDDYYGDERDDCSCDECGHHLVGASASTSTGARVRPLLGKRLPSRKALTVTKTAVDQVKMLMADNPGALGLRIGVKTRGCNGLTYTLEIANETQKFDEVVEQDGIRLYIDSKAQMSILGSEMDYQTDRLSSEFVFNNPNIKGTCGCGESFSV